MNKKNIIITIVVVVLAGGALWLFYGGNPVSEIKKGGIEILKNQDTNIPFADKYLDLKISQEGFSPAKFKGRKSDQLHITLINEEQGNPNTFKFETLPFDAIAPSGGKTTFTVIVPSEPGEYVFFTDVGQIRKGSLIVE